MLASRTLEGTPRKPDPVRIRPESAAKNFWEVRWTFRKIPKKLADRPRCPKKVLRAEKKQKKVKKKRPFFAFSGGAQNVHGSAKSAFFAVAWPTSALCGGGGGGFNEPLIRNRHFHVFGLSGLFRGFQPARKSPIS
jgi:hypothetical protein